MRASKSKTVFNSSLLTVCAIGLSACAVATPPTITASQANAVDVRQVELLGQAQEEGLRSQFKGELVRSFETRGVTVEKGAGFIADFSVSQRSAELGTQAFKQDQAEEQPPRSDYRSNWLNKCKADRVSASLVVYARDNGRVKAKSSGEFLACPGDLSQLGDLAQLLVSRTLQQ